MACSGGRTLLPCRGALTWKLLELRADRYPEDADVAAIVDAFWESEIEHVFTRDPNALFGGWLPRVAGMKVVFCADAPLGHHVVSLDVNGKSLDPAATYTLASCEREGDAPDTMCRMKHVADVKAMTLDVHTMLRDWLGAHDPVSAPTLGNVVATDLPPHVFSQWERR